MESDQCKVHIVEDVMVRRPVVLGTIFELAMARRNSAAQWANTRLLLMIAHEKLIAHEKRPQQERSWCSHLPQLMPSRFSSNAFFCPTMAVALLHHMIGWGSRSGNQGEVAFFRWMRCAQPKMATSTASSLQNDLPTKRVPKYVGLVFSRHALKIPPLQNAFPYLPLAPSTCTCKPLQNDPAQTLKSSKSDQVTKCRCTAPNLHIKP